MHWENYSYNAKTQELVRGTAAVRKGRWKAMITRLNQPPALYDLSVDEAEANDVSATHLRIARQLSAAMRNAHTAPLPHTGIMEWVR